MDMAGNVWEWRLNEYDNPENTGIDGKETRSLRGGSWCDSPVDVRAAYRGGDDPGNRNHDIGFRVVRSSPISR